MGRSLLVETDALEAAARLIDDIPCDLGMALASLRQVLVTHTAPWGDDHPGHTFASRHQPDATRVLSAIDHLIRAIGSTADGLQAMSADMTDADRMSAIP